MLDRSKRRQVTSRRLGDIQAVRNNESAELAPANAHLGLEIFAVRADKVVEI
jgi:hypothetical protein